MLKFLLKIYLETVVYLKPDFNINYFEFNINYFYLKTDFNINYFHSKFENSNDWVANFLDNSIYNI